MWKIKASSLNKEKQKITDSINIRFKELEKLEISQKLQKDKIKHNKDFYVFTGSSVGVVPILSKGVYKGTIERLGSVNAKIN